MSAQVEALQKEINRFASDPSIGFIPIACDGDVGPKTMRALILALSNISLTSGQDDIAYQADALVQELDRPADILVRTEELTRVVAAGAFSMGLSYAPCPRPPASTTEAAAQGTPTTPKAQALVNKYKKKINGGILGLGLPDWMVYGLGGVFVLGVGYLVMARPKQGGSAGRFAHPRLISRRDESTMIDEE